MGDVAIQLFGAFLESSVVPPALHISFKSAVVSFRILTCSKQIVWDSFQRLLLANLLEQQNLVDSRNRVGTGFGNGTNLWANLAMESNASRISTSV